MSRVIFTDREQADITEMQALADSAEDNGFALVNALLFASDYRVDGGLVNPDAPASGVVKIDPGVFVKADGKFYKLLTEATGNILTGTESQVANIWGAGQAADAAHARLDIIVVSFQFLDSGSSVKNFIDDSVTPPVQYTQSVNTRRNGAPAFAVLHGTPSASPVEPAVPSGFLKLATISVAANATVINSGDITNNLDINVKTLEKLQQASQAQAAFSDILHSNGVYKTVLGELAVTETGPQSMAVSVLTGVALLAGVTARVATNTTVPIDAASFASKAGESVTFTTDTQVLQCNGTPPHKIRAGTVVIAGKTEGVDFSVDYTAGTITRLGGGSIAPGGTVSVNYDYYLPRIDRIELLMSNSTPQVVKGVAAQAPVEPAADPNTLTLAHVYVDEGVTVIANAKITDERVYLPTMDEVIAARSSAETGSHASLDDRIEAHEARAITSGQSAHGIQQGSGNGLDADKVDGIHASTTPQANKLLALDGSSKIPANVVTQGSGSGLDADSVDGIQASASATPNKLMPLNGFGKYPVSVITQGLGSGLDADTVDGFPARATPQPNTIPVLDGSGKLPLGAIPNLLGNSVLQALVMVPNVVAPNSKIDVTIDAISIQGVLVSNLAQTADIGLVGVVNGLDTGTEASSTWYAIHAITNDAGSVQGVLLSLSASAPTLPTGFTKFRRIGWVRNDGSSNFIHFYRYKDRVNYEDPTLNLSASPAGVTSFASWIPPTSRIGKFALDSVIAVGAAIGTTGFNVRLPGVANYMHYWTSGYDEIQDHKQVVFNLSSSQTLDIAGIGSSNNVYVEGYYDPV